MGNHSSIVDLRGFEATLYSDSGAESLYHAMNERDPSEIKEALDGAEDDKLRAILVKLIADLKALDPDICCHIADQCLGRQPLALGWRSGIGATPEKLEALRRLLRTAGFSAHLLSKDRFLTYG